MRLPTPGLHPVSAIARDPRANVEFYTDALGLRFVKRTVNFDDKFAYHLYYGDDRATSGTLLTFFPYPRGDDGRVGRPQPGSVAFSVPGGSAGYWYDRLRQRGVDADEPTERFGEPTVAFRDPDGLAVELVERDAPRGPATDAVPSDRAVRTLHSVTLLSTSIYHTAATLEVLGFELLDQEGDRVRYRAPGEYGADVDLLDVEAEYGREGSGAIHHVAFGAGDASLPEWRDRLLEAGLEPTFVKDRYYFESIYVREPGGILFEIANAGSGITVDEDLEEPGSTRSLQPRFEADREMIVSQLPDIEAPDG